MALVVCGAAAHLHHHSSSMPPSPTAKLQLTRKQDDRVSLPVDSAAITAALWLGVAAGGLKEYRAHQLEQKGVVAGGAGGVMTVLPYILHASTAVSFNSACPP